MSGMVKSPTIKHRCRRMRITLVDGLRYGTRMQPGNHAKTSPENQNSKSRPSIKFGNLTYTMVFRHA